MKTDVSGLCEFGRDFGLSSSTFDVFFDVFSRRFLLPDVLRPDSCFRTLLLSDSRRLDAASGADVSAPGGPHARRFPAAQPLRAVL